MKKLITLSVICIIASLVFPSCKSEVSVTKRHYTRGYYVAHGHKTVKSEISLKNKEKIVRFKTDKPSNVLQTKNKKDENVAVSNFYRIPVTNNSAYTASNEKKQSHSNSNQTIKPLKNNSDVDESKSIEERFTDLKNDISTSKKSVRATHNHEEYSLLWIIIVVVLILWVLGFLAGGFGLGGLINLLLLVALILFILWLLKVI